MMLANDGLALGVLDSAQWKAYPNPHLRFRALARAKAKASNVCLDGVLTYDKGLGCRLEWRYRLGVLGLGED